MSHFCNKMVKSDQTFTTNFVELGKSHKSCHENILKRYLVSEH